MRPLTKTTSPRSTKLTVPCGFIPAAEATEVGDTTAVAFSSCASAEIKWNMYPEPKRAKDKIFAALALSVAISASMRKIYFKYSAFMMGSQVHFFILGQRTLSLFYFEIDIRG
jgi:hypothetical protein